MNKLEVYELTPAAKKVFAEHSPASHSSRLPLLRAALLVMTRQDDMDRCIRSIKALTERGGRW